MESNSIITYETLYELLRKEKTRPELQELPFTFFQDVLNYLKEKTLISTSKKDEASIFAKMELQQTQTQLSNIIRIIKEIYEKRESKIIQLALISSRTDSNTKSINLLPEEKTFYSLIKEDLDLSRKGILENLIEGQFPKISKKTKDIKMDNLATKEQETVRIVHPIPQFIGPNKQIYGPFEGENIINIPSSLANLLIKSKRAEKI